MNELWHILERAMIHFFSATSLVLVVFMLLRSLARRKAARWLPTSWKASLVMAALLVFAISTMREAYDVANGQVLVKAFTDYISWCAGCGVAVWGLFRFAKETQG